MNVLHGDLLRYAKEGKFDAIVHGCNCFNNMGAGIAREIKGQFPKAYEADLATVRGSRDKLGTYTFATTKYNFVVINAYTQYQYGRGQNHADYDAIREVFTKINNDFKGKRIGIPKIGAGLAGGDWRIIEKILEEVCTDINLTLVLWS